MTDEQIREIALEHGCNPARAIVFARAILAATGTPGADRQGDKAKD